MGLRPCPSGHCSLRSGHITRCMLIVGRNLIKIRRYVRMKTIFLMFIFLLLSVPGFVYAGSGCEVVSVSFYDDVDVDGGHVIPGTNIVTGQSASSHPCATVTIKNTSGGGRLSGKIIARFVDGKSKTKSIKSSRFISDGQIYTTNICWGRKSELDKFDCEF